MLNNNYAILSTGNLIDIIKAMDLYSIFGGVYAKDQLNKITKMKNKLFIINLDDSSNSGTHWCCFSTFDNNVCYYDSYGGPPPIEVDNYIKQATNKNKYEVNKAQIQDLGSEYCGWFCCLFLWFIVNTEGTIKNKIKHFNHMFNSYDLSDNKDKLLKYLSRVFNLSKK
jgi:hypothetical protein